MIATFVQDDLAAELAEILKDLRLQDPQGGRVPVNIYKQFLPIYEAQEIPDTVTDEELEEGTYDAQAVQVPFPYVLVRVAEGVIESIDGEQAVDINLIIGVIDRSRDNQGYKDILNIMQDVYLRFSKNAILAQKYECMMPIQWALQEEESYPYFFGGMALRFETAAIKREDPYI